MAGPVKVIYNWDPR